MVFAGEPEASASSLGEFLCIGFGAESLEAGYVTGALSGEFFVEVAEHVAQTQTVARNLVGVGRADALARGADFAGAFGCLVGSVEQAMGGGDEIDFLRNAEDVAQGDAALLKLLGFLTEQHRVEHHAVAYDVNLPMLENARGNGAEHILFALELKGVSGVGASLEAGHSVIARGQYVDHLTFSFVAPLEPEKHVYFHVCQMKYVLKSE